MYSISFTRTQCSEYWVYWCEHFRNCYNKHTDIETFVGGNIHMEVLNMGAISWDYQIALELSWCEPKWVIWRIIQLKFCMNPTTVWEKHMLAIMFFFKSSKMIKQMRTQTLLWIIKFSKIDKLLTRKKYFIFEVLFQFLLSPDPYLPSKLLISF